MPFLTGLDLRLKSYDDKSDPVEGEKQAEIILKDSDTLAVLGAINSGVTLPASQVFARDNLVMVSPKSTNPKVTERGLANVNRICARDDAQGPAAAEFVAGALGASSVYVFDDATVYGQGLAALFRKALPPQVKVVGTVSTAQTTDYDRIVEDLKTLKPDVVYFAADYDQVIPMLKAMRSAKVSSGVVGSDAMNTPLLAKSAGQAAVGAYFTDIVAPANAYPQAKDFVSKYRKQFGRDPSGNAVLGYDSMAVLLEGLRLALKQTSVALLDRKAVSQAVRKVKLSGALTGEIRFNGAGDRERANIFILNLSGDLGTRVNRVIPVRPPAP